MSLTNTQLLDALNKAIRSADTGGNTSAADVRSFLTALLSYLQDNQDAVAAQLATQQQQYTQQLANVVHLTGNETLAGSKTFADPIGVATFQRNGRYGLVKATLDNAIGLNGMVLENTTLPLADLGFRVPSGEQFNLRFENRSPALLNTANAEGEFQFTDPVINGQTLGTADITFFSVGKRGASFRNGVRVGINTDTPTELLEVNGNVKAAKFIGDGSQLTKLPSDATKADLAEGKIPASQLPTRDPYALQDNTDVAHAVVGGTYANGELLSSSTDYAKATSAEVVAGDRIVSTGYLHEYCRTAAGPLGWVRWPKG